MKITLFSIKKLTFFLLKIVKTTISNYYLLSLKWLQVECIIAINIHELKQSQDHYICHNFIFLHNLLFFKIIIKISYFSICFYKQTTFFIVKALRYVLFPCCFVNMYNNYDHKLSMQLLNFYAQQIFFLEIGFVSSKITSLIYNV